MQTNAFRVALAFANRASGQLEEVAGRTITSSAPWIRFASASALPERVENPHVILYPFSCSPHPLIPW